MIKAAILDDERHSVETLEWKVKHYCTDVDIVASFTDPLAAIAFLKENPVDLLFIDIEMPLMSGFDVLEELKYQVSFHVIFVTAHDAFGIKAIKFSALDYLLKPVQNTELQLAVEKCRNALNPEIRQQKLEQLRGNVEAELKNIPGKIALASKENIEFVEANNIVVCEASSNYTNIYLETGGKRVISKTLKEFEFLLSGYGFFRPHNSFLVNISKITEFLRQDGGYLVMSNKMKIPVSKSRKDQLMALVNR